MVYSISCSRSFTALDLVSGRLEVSAQIEDRKLVLKRTRLGDEILRRTAAQQIWDQPSISPVNHRCEIWTASELKNIQGNVDAGRMTEMLVPVGLPSEDGSAMIGENGQLFLLGGTNSLLAQYSIGFDYGPAGLEGIADAWVAIFEERRRLALAAGFQYLQTVIPEKLTALRGSAPTPIKGPTLLFQEVEKRVNGCDYYTSGLEPFDHWTKRDSPYLATDTHFSAAGAQAMFIQILEAIAPSLIPVVQNIRMDTLGYEIGDLTNRFSGLPLYSKKYEPSISQMAPFSSGIEMTRRYFPPSGFIGRSFAWTNSTAPCDLSVLVFGNSFFGGGDVPGQLAWWGKRFFKNFRLEWNPSFEWSIANEVSPDFIIGQTIERFLPKLPSA